MQGEYIPVSYFVLFRQRGRERVHSEGGRKSIPAWQIGRRRGLGEHENAGATVHNPCRATHGHAGHIRIALALLVCSSKHMTDMRGLLPMHSLVGFPAPMHSPGTHAMPGTHALPWGAWVRCVPRGTSHRGRPLGRRPRSFLESQVRASLQVVAGRVEFLFRLAVQMLRLSLNSSALVSANPRSRVAAVRVVAKASESADDKLTSFKKPRQLIIGELFKRCNMMVDAGMSREAAESCLENSEWVASGPVKEVVDELKLLDVKVNGLDVKVNVLVGSDDHTEPYGRCIRVW